MYFYVTLSKVGDAASLARAATAAVRTVCQLGVQKPTLRRLPFSQLSQQTPSIQTPTPTRPDCATHHPPQRLLKDHDEVQLSALGTAVSTMVSVAEILKKEGFVVEKGERLGG